MNVLVLNGPNLNALGTREPGIYGTATLADIEAALAPVAAELGAALEWFQSNHEGALIDRLQARAKWAEGALLNAGALTHYGYALADAVRAFDKPVVEVHLSNVHARESWRRRSVLAAACAGGVYGFGADSYRVALLALAERLRGESPPGP
ncbi:MAG TPA: type II 3-dehydroquinate dehydratase [Gemmatimonadota bacterium]|nr:type II 3-dehydroquinate dehydratase [Gemmatimonadota bacterium]